jgi:Squalene-hopene cyclase C-terminal domain
MSDSKSKSDKSSQPRALAASSSLSQRMKLDGGTVLVACPTCDGPMSVRIWLMEAECWQCGTRIELSQADRAFLEQMIAQAAKETNRSAPAPKPKQLEPVKPPTPRPVPKPVARKLLPPAAPIAKSVQAPPVQQTLRELVWRPWIDWRGLLDRAPAWLVSLLFHLLLFLLLALVDDGQDRPPKIVLSVAISNQREEGDIASIAPAKVNAFDFPIPDDLDTSNPKVMKQIEEAAELAGEIGKFEVEEDFKPESMQQLRDKLTQPYKAENGLAARDIRMRREVLETEGGTLLTEAAVARALVWFVQHQQPNGSWKLDSREYGSDRGDISTDSGATALALLPFLGAGQTHKTGIYRNVVANGLDYLLERQLEDGDLRGGTQGEAGMYVHGQATIVLCEAYAMTRDRKLKSAATKAVDFILNAQHSAGGWRYRPGMAGDTSVLGWQLMALQSARMAGMSVPQKCFQQASRYLDSASELDGAVYAYQPGHSPTPNMTAEGLLCRFYLDGNKRSQAIETGLDILLARNPPSRENMDFYYLYYATQAFHQAGGERWSHWNALASTLLVGEQRTKGPHAGSWDVRGYLAEAGGRLYVTSLATCTLEVYYRHIPLFEPME